MKVIWTEQAAAKLLEIEDFIARDSRPKAERFVDRLIERGERTSSFPLAGRKVPELNSPAIREVFEGNYRLVYRVKKAEIEILTIFEGHLPLPENDVPAQ